MSGVVSEFVLVLAGVTELTPTLADHLFEVTGGDIELNTRDGVAFIEFRRDTDDLREAIVTAIRQVESAVPGIKVLRVESEAANTIARINADLLTLLSTH